MWAKHAVDRTLPVGPFQVKEPWFPLFLRRGVRTWVTCTKQRLYPKSEGEGSRQHNEPSALGALQISCWMGKWHQHSLSWWSQQGLHSRPPSDSVARRTLGHQLHRHQRPSVTAALALSHSLSLSLESIHIHVHSTNVGKMHSIQYLPKRHAQESFNVLEGLCKSVYIATVGQSICDDWITLVWPDQCEETTRTKNKPAKTPSHKQPNPTICFSFADCITGTSIGQWNRCIWATSSSNTTDLALIRGTRVWLCFENPNKQTPNKKNKNTTTKKQPNNTITAKLVPLKWNN